MTVLCAVISGRKAQLSDNKSSEFSMVSMFVLYLEQCLLSLQGQRGKMNNVKR
jgi:hypothetical protein